VFVEGRDLPPVPDAIGDALPLALTLSIAAAQNGGWSPGRDETGEMVRTLVRRLAEAEIEGRYRDVLGVACTARVTTLELLRDVLPETDPEDGLRWLESRSLPRRSAEGSPSTTWCAGRCAPT
jgi:hypothetical protein